MIYTGYLDFWFKDIPLPARIEKFVDLGITRFDVWCWRSIPLDDIAAECQRLGARLNSTFDEQMGSLADPGDNELTIRSWAESLEMAERYKVDHLFIFSNQIDIIEGREWTLAAIPQCDRGRAVRQPAQPDGKDYAAGRANRGGGLA